MVIIHYAQFEKPFLLALHREAFGKDAIFPWPIICTQRLAAKLFPNLPSRTLRALAGHFGFDLGESHRAMDHLRATATIWANLNGQTAPAPHDYLVQREKRLELPKGPGIYEMLSSRGKVLYVGKATSLRDRVNSYFRTQKTTRKKLKELMTQVAEVRVTPTATPLEAALLENDRIKELEPPYNISLRQRERRLYYYSADLVAGEGEGFTWGPFSSEMSFDMLEQLKALATHSLAFNVPYWLRHPPHALFPALETLGLASWDTDRRPITLMAMLKLGKRLREDPEGLDEFQTYLRKKLRQAAWSLHRARWLPHLLNCRVAWEYKTGTRFLIVENGQVTMQGDGDLSDAGYRRRVHTRTMDVATFDRLRVLVSGLCQAARRGKAIAIQFSPQRIYGAEQLLRMVGDHPLNPSEEEEASWQEPSDRADARRIPWNEIQRCRSSCHGVASSSPRTRNDDRTHDTHSPCVTSGSLPP